MDVHARGKQHVHTIVDHFLTHFCGEGFHQFRVPGTGQRSPAGDERTVLFQSQSRRTVGGDDRRNAFLPQALQNAAEGTGIPGYAEIAPHHAVAAGQSFQFPVAQTGNKIVQCDVSVAHIPERILPDPCHGYGLRQAVQDPPMQFHTRFAEGLALLHGDFLRRSETSRIRFVGCETVFACFHYKAAALFVIGGQALIVAAKRNCLALAGGKGFGFPEGCKHAQRFIQASDRGVTPEQYGLLTGNIARVCNCNHCFRSNSGMLQALGTDSKARVAQPETERIKNGLRIPVKVPVPHIDPFGIIVNVPATEICAAGIVLVAPGNRIAELSAWIHCTRQHVSHGVAALHAALPDNHESRDLIPVFLNPGHVHNVADIQQDNDVGEG